MPERHNSHNTNARLMDLSKERNFLDMIFFYCVDKVSINIKCMELIYDKHSFSLYVGGRLLHKGYYALVFNLSCLESIKN